jgi:hypothetical protein
VRDALSLIATIRDDQQHRARHILVGGVEGAGVIAAAATALAQPAVYRLACDTEGFRFAGLDNVWDVNFVPGAEKYGDVPAILSLCAPTRTTIAGENLLTAEGVVSSFALANGHVEFAGGSKASGVDSVASALAGGS